MKKLLSLLLALALVLSLVPVMASAKTTKPGESTTTTQSETSKKGDKKKDNKKDKNEEKKEETKTENKEDKKSNKKEDDKHDKKGDRKDDKDGKYDKHHKKGGRKPSAPQHKHEYGGYGSNPTYHWLECSCGCKISMEPHVDPLDTDDDYCFCGYHFSDNADLVTLWVRNCPPIKNFNKNKTEYTLDAYTYKDVTEIEIATNTFDSEATVEVPEDLTLKEGENKFEIKVTSENKKVTKIYTVIVNKEVKK